MMRQGKKNRKWCLKNGTDKREKKQQGIMMKSIRKRGKEEKMSGN